MLSMGLILAIMSVAVEMAVVVQYEGLRNFMIHHEKFGLFFSFFLSFFIGEVFGAHGIIALFAGMTSTVMTLAIYRLHLLKLVDDYRKHKDEIHAKTRESAAQVVSVLKFWWKILAAPWRAWCAIKVFARQGRDLWRGYTAPLRSWRAKRAV